MLIINLSQYYYELSVLPLTNKKKEEINELKSRNIITNDVDYLIIHITPNPVIERGSAFLILSRGIQNSSHP